MGVWEENDGHVPKLGEGVLYDWEDTGIGDNTGNPDHVGTVTYVNQASGYFVVTEGNFGNAVKKRTMDAISEDSLLRSMTPMQHRVIRFRHRARALRQWLMRSSQVSGEMEMQERTL